MNIAAQKQFFSTGQTLPIEFRLRSLNKLEKMILDGEEEILRAIYADLKRPSQEAWLTDIGSLLAEIRFAKKNLAKWMAPKSVGSPIVLFPAKSKIHSEPLGVVLIISSWNYNFSLALSPLIGAIAAGNCATVKPSEVSPMTSKVIAHLLKKSFEPEYIDVVEGDASETTKLLGCPFDHIFFTGSTEIGKVIMQAAAKNLVPVTLELGGKCPVIVDESANLGIAAKRIIWAKLINAGQTCLAPDYILVCENKKTELLSLLVKEIQKQLGIENRLSPDLARIINKKHWDRLVALINKSKVYYGGEVDAKELYIQPTVLTNIDWDDPLMQNEIFGPLLPVLSYKSLDEVWDTLRKRPKPLAAYLFTESGKTQNSFIHRFSFGGGCVNEVIAHYGNPNLPFGGVGNSGMGKYHGVAGFLTFSHQKSILRSSGWLDYAARYAPYSLKKLNFAKKFF